MMIRKVQVDVQALAPLKPVPELEVTVTELLATVTVPLATVEHIGEVIPVPVTAVEPLVIVRLVSTGGPIRYVFENELSAILHPPVGGVPPTSCVV